MLYDFIRSSHHSNSAQNIRTLLEWCNDEISILVAFFQKLWEWSLLEGVVPLAQPILHCNLSQPIYPFCIDILHNFPSIAILRKHLAAASLCMTHLAPIACTIHVSNTFSNIEPGEPMAEVSVGKTDKQGNTNLPKCCWGQILNPWPIRPSSMNPNVTKCQEKPQKVTLLTSPKTAPATKKSDSPRSPETMPATTRHFPVLSLSFSFSLCFSFFTLHFLFTWLFFTILFSCGGVKTREWGVSQLLHLACRTRKTVQIDVSGRSVVFFVSFTGWCKDSLPQGILVSEESVWYKRFLFWKRVPDVKGCSSWQVLVWRTGARIVLHVLALRLLV